MLKKKEIRRKDNITDQLLLYLQKILTQSRRHATSFQRRYNVIGCPATLHRR